MIFLQTNLNKHRVEPKTSVQCKIKVSKTPFSLLRGPQTLVPSIVLAVKRSTVIVIGDEDIPLEKRSICPMKALAGTNGRTNSRRLASL